MKPVAAAVAGIALATLVVFGLREIAPVLSLGVVYLLVVLVVATLWGFWSGVGTAVLSALAYNFFHIPPTGRFTIASSRNLVGLLAFIGVAAAASAVAELARRRATEATQRREEADLAAAAARDLLGGARLEDGLAQTAQAIADALGVPSAHLTLGAAPAGSSNTYTLGAGAATLTLPQPLRPAMDARLRARIVPALETILTSAIERDALLDEVVETSALRRSDDLKTAILRAVSHDLRSPLTAMITSGEALGSTALDDEDRAALSAAVVEEGARLERLIGKLLDLSRLEAGEAQPRLDLIDLAEVLTAARDELPPDTDAEHLVTLQLDRDLPPLRADAVQLERAFANLMENGLSHGGGQPVSVRARAVGHRVVVRVVDRGPGIPQPEQARIFSPFYRGPDASPTATGAGLGLAIVRGFVEANGGTVRVESLPGQGASFVVEFPLT